MAKNQRRRSFVLWTIDKYAGARRLVDELKLVRDENTPADTKTKN
jgi:hypothetical protein